MSIYDCEKRSIVWSACDTDDPKTCAEYTEFDSQAEAEEFARERGLPYVVGHVLITFNEDEDDWEFDEDAEPVFIRLHDVPLRTAAELAKRRAIRLKCLACSFTQEFTNQREAENARDMHEWENMVHPVCVQTWCLITGRWMTRTADGSIDYPRPADYGTTAADISE